MSVSDPIADALTRIRNAQGAGHDNVEVKTSKMLDAILEILKNEGFIFNTYHFKEKNTNMVKIDLKYYKREPVIKGIQKVSRSGRRIYVRWKDIRPTLNNIGLSIFSTPKGILSGKDAKNSHVGGEYICRVW